MPLHFPVELSQRIHIDLADQLLDCALVLRRVIDENARSNYAAVSLGAEDLRDALWHFAFPVRSDK